MSEHPANEEELDWLRVVKPSKGDVRVRVSDPYSQLDTLPAANCLMAVSNTWGLCFVGGDKGECDCDWNEVLKD